MTVEPNAIAQEAGLSAVMEYVSNAPNAISTRDTIIPALVEKCLGAIKAGTKQKATDIVLLYAEIDTPDPVVELVLPGTNAKQPKLVTQTVFVLKELVRQFGIKKVNPKPIIKILPRLFGHTDKNVRAETFALTVELYRWIGQPLMASLSTLKPVQIKDLEEAFSKLPSEKPSPERLIRSEQAIQEVEQAQNDVEVDDTLAENEMEIDEVDAFDLADPVDITAKLPANFYELLQSKKWQERREALDALLDQTKTPKIMDKDYSELIGALAKRINDSNILLVGATATCIEHIATGLRTDFGKYKPIIAPVMIEKLKERKPAILEQLANGLNAVFSSVPMSELIEDVTVASKHKNPQVRSECFKLLARRLKEVKEMPGKTEIKSFAELFKNLLDDADANAREAGAEGLGTLMKLVGEKPMLVFTDGLNDIQMGKIREAYEKATVKVKASKKVQPPPAAVKSVPPKAVRKAAPPARLASKPTPEPMSIDEVPDAATNNVNSMIPPKRKPPSRLAGASSMKKPALLSSKPKASAPASAAATGPKKSAKLPPPSGPEEIKYKYSQEDAEVRAAEFIPEAILTDLKHAQWKIRLSAMESLRQHLEQMDGSAIEPEIIIRSFSKKPGWKEMNFQVMSNVISSIQDLVVKCPNFNKACGVLCIPVLVDKLSDAKLKKLSGECLATIAEKFSLQFVFSQAYPLLKKAKSPKVLSDCLLWIYSTLMDFGIHGLQIRDLIDLVKFGLTNINATVRTHSVTLLGALRQFVGPEVKSFVEDVSPALLATIEQEFERVSKLDPPQPTKAPKGSVRNGGVEVSDGNDANADAIESLFPRVDISGPLNKTVAQCGDANWKIRKEGLDNVIQIIAGANNRIKPNLGTEFPGVLKQRLNDSNKNLQIMAVEIAGSLAVAMGKPFEKYIKIFTGPVIAVLSDNKANVRAAGVKALENFRNTCSMELMAPIFGTSLANEAPTLRKELLSWISSSIKKEADAAKYDFTGMVTPLFSCLQDRNGDVRKAAQACLPEIVAIVGYDNVIGKTSELKAAQRQTVLPLIEAARGSATIITAPSSVTPTSSVSRKRPESMYATDDHGRSPAAAAPSRIKAPLKKKIGGIPAPRSQATSHASATFIEDATTPILTSDPRAKQMRAKKEIRWQFDSPRSDIIDSLKATFDTNMNEMEIDELPSLNNLPRLGGRSQITKPRSTANLQRAIQHPQVVSEPEPMEDITDDHDQRIIEPHANRINPDIRQIRPVSFGSQHQQYQPHSSFVSNPTEIFDYLISQINSSNQHESIDALKGIDKLLRQNVKSALPDIGRIINGITLQIKMASSATDPRQGLTPRLCKHIVNVLVLVFSRPVLVSAIPVEGLQHLLEQLARRLLDQKTNGSETGPQLSKALNVAMVKILENSERNQTFSALLAILSSGSERLLDNTIAIAQEAKYIELIMKCLWKLAKTIQESLKLSILNPDALLFDINRFFLTTPPTTWKQRAANKIPLGEMPLRTVKTLLLELVNGLRDSIFRHLTMIDNPQDSHVYPYLLHMLDACRKKDQEDNPHYQQQQQEQQRLQLQQQQQQQQISLVTPQQLEENAPNHLLSHSHNSSQSRPTSTSSHKSDTVARSLSAVSYPSNDVEQHYVDNPTLPAPNASIQSPHLSSPVLNNIALNSIHPMQIDQPTVNEYVQQGLTDYDLNVKLTRIFHKIGNRDYTKQGIIELYEFQKSYPHASGKVNNYLSQTGSYFQSYIRRGLSNLEAEDNELQAQSQGQSTMASTSPTPTSTIGKELPSFSSSINTTERQQERSIFESQQARNDISRASVHAAGNIVSIYFRKKKKEKY
ncbi:MAG: armadillo-type protein [Benjaminiella poitrasii]|nr:MAG: armadillo-type protein [Benjaminiella poitrasii]